MTKQAMLGYIFENQAIYSVGIPDHGFSFESFLTSNVFFKFRELF